MRTIGWAGWAAMAVAANAVGAVPDIPFRAGVSFVVAVNSPAGNVKKGLGIVAGDYELVVQLDAVTANDFTQTTYFDGPDESGVHRRGKVRRTIRLRDLENGGIQVQGFHSTDPPVIPGTTALGPSREWMRTLRARGAAPYAFRQFAFNDVIEGTLRRVPGDVKFPVIVNGRRVELSAIKVEGQLAQGDVSAPAEMILLDHPQHPFSLRIAYGARGEGFPFKPRFAREIVRIDYADDEQRLEKALEQNCRVEVPGIYFDFNLDSIKPESKPALEQIAATVRAVPGRRIVIEGHTDDVGSEAYNDDLSARRAQAVRAALADEPGVDVSKVTTRGFGERKPIESNQTIAGRARNRRVELACAP